MRRAAVLALLLCLTAVADARACSCVATAPEEKLAGADAAFVGTVTAVRSEAAEGSTPTLVRRVRVYTVAVERAYKGGVGATAEVRGEDPDAGAFTSCGEHFEVGDTIGGYFDGPPEEWFIFSCNGASREELDRAARGLPAPRGAGAAVALIAGPFGRSPFAALDARGRVVAYARGRGGGFGAVRLSVCPGGRYVVESGADAVRTRRLADLRVTRRLGRGSGDVRCLDARGTAAVLARRGRVQRLRGGRALTLARARSEVAAAGPIVSVLGSSLVDSRSGRLRRLPEVDVRAVSVAPGGRRVAVLARGTLTTYSSAGRRLSRRPGEPGTAEIAWTPGGRAVAVPRSRTGAAFVRGTLWWIRDGTLRSGSRRLARAPDSQPFGARVVPLPRPTTIRDRTRFNPAPPTADLSRHDSRGLTPCVAPTQGV